MYHNILCITHLLPICSPATLHILQGTFQRWEQVAVHVKTRSLEEVVALVKDKGAMAAARGKAQDDYKGQQKRRADIGSQVRLRGCQGGRDDRLRASRRRIGCFWWQCGHVMHPRLHTLTQMDLRQDAFTRRETFVANPKLDVAKVISELAVGEALVSMLLDKGIPMPVERAFICPPRSRMGAITAEERDLVRNRSPLGGKYDTRVNRESAFEKLAARAQEKAAEAPASGPGSTPVAKTADSAKPSKLDDFLWGNKRRQGAIEAAAKSATRTVATGLGRQILRGVLGGIFGGKRR